MSDPAVPLQEQAQPVSAEGATGTGERAQQATPPSPYEHVRPTTLPPFTPIAQPPSPWPVYTPGTGRQWRGDGFAPPLFAAHAGRRRIWPWIVFIVVLLVVVVSGGTFFLVVSQGYHLGTASPATQRYAVSTNPTIVLKNDTGSIHVQAGASSTDVIIQVTRHPSWWGNADDMNVTYAQDTASNTVAVTVERPGNIAAFGSSSVDFDLTVPGTADLQLKTNTGSIDVSGVSGQQVLTSNTGSVHVSGGTLSGNSQLLTNTGSVSFTGSMDRTGTYRLQTNTGSINVTIPGTSIFHVDASTDTGTINTSFPTVVVVRRQFTGAEAHSDVGGVPHAIITLTTNTGSINLYQR